jgi:hypothetical protein
MPVGRRRFNRLCSAIAFAVTGLFKRSTLAASKPTVVSDAEKAANWIVTALAASGYRVDFSMESLQEIERFFTEHSNEGKPKAGGLLSQDIGARLFALGSYVGEVIRREGKGEWVVSDGDPQAEINIAVRLPPDVLLWPVQRVMKRLRNGPEENIYHYGLAALGRPGTSEIERTGYGPHRREPRRRILGVGTKAHGVERTQACEGLARPGFRGVPRDLPVI